MNNPKHHRILGAALGLAMISMVTTLQVYNCDRHRARYEMISSRTQEMPRSRAGLPNPKDRSTAMKGQGICYGPPMPGETDYKGNPMRP